MNGFSSFLANLLTILVYNSEVGDVGFGMIVGHTVLVNSTDDVTAVFFDSILQTSAGYIYVGKVTIFFWAGPFVDNVCLRCDGVLSLGCIKMNYRVLIPLKMTCTLVLQKILLNSSLRPGTYGTRMKIFLLISKPVLVFTVGVVSFFSRFLMIQSGYLFLSRTP